MAVENITANRGYQLPHLTNKQKDDVFRLIAAFEAIDADMAAVIALLATKAALANPALTGNPTAPTQSPGNNSTRIATTAFIQAALAAFSPTSVNAGNITSGTMPDARLSFTVTTFIKTLLDDASNGAARTTLDVYSKAEVTTAISAAITALVGGAPGALDVLNELAAAIDNDPNFATTMTNALAGKATKADGTQALAKAGSDTVQRTWRATDLKDAALAAGGWVPDAILEDQKLSGTSGGTSVGSTWTAHALNTKVFDRFGIITLLGGGEFTVSANGWAEWEIVCFGIKMTSRLWNVTDGVEAGRGMTARGDTSPTTGALSTGGAPLIAGKTYRPEYFDLGGGQSLGLGAAASQGTEVYMRMQIGKSD